MKYTHISITTNTFVFGYYLYIEREKNEKYILGMGRMDVNFLLYFKYFEGE